MVTPRAISASCTYIGVLVQLWLFERTDFVHRLIPCIRIFSMPYIYIYTYIYIYIYIYIYSESRMLRIRFERRLVFFWSILCALNKSTRDFSETLWILRIYLGSTRRNLVLNTWNTTYQSYSLRHGLAQVAVWQLRNTYTLPSMGVVITLRLLELGSARMHRFCAGITDRIFQIDQRSGTTIG